MSEHESVLGQLLGGFAGVKVNSAYHNIAIYHSSLLLIEGSDVDTVGLRALLADTHDEELLRCHRFVAFADVGHAWIVRADVPVKVVLDMADGDQLTIVEEWTSQTLGEDDRTLLVALLTGLRDTGPMREPAAAEAARTWAEDAVVLDAAANVSVDGVDHDVLILDVGFVFIAGPGHVNMGKARLTTLLESTPLHEIVGRNWLVRYEHIVDAKINKPIPVRGEIELHDGRRLTMKESWVGESLTEDTNEVLIAVLRSVGAPAPV